MIPEQIIQAIKESSDLKAILNSLGLSFQKRGETLFTSCPFHEEKTPSLSVDPEKKIYHCLGCGAKGTIFQLIERLEHLSFPEAVKRVATLSGYAFTPSPEPSSLRASPDPFPEQDRTQLLTAVFKRFKTHYTQSHPAQNYLHKTRGLKPMPDLEVGYCPADFGQTLEPSLRQPLIHLGLLHKSGRPHFANCLTFALKDPVGQDPVGQDTSGRITSLYGRKIKAPGKSDTTSGKHYYLPGERQGLFALHNDKSQETYIVESILDALSVHQLTSGSVLALNGVNGFSPSHESWLKEKHTDTLYILLDGDKAGREASLRLSSRLKRQGYKIHVIELPKGEDPNSYFSVGGHTLKDLHSLPGYPKDTEPKTPAPSLSLCENGRDYALPLGERVYTIIGFKPDTLDKLRITLKCSHKDNASLSHTDPVDFYTSRSLKTYSKHAGEELSVSCVKIQQELKQLSALLETKRIEHLKSKTKATAYTMSEPERQKALDFLKNPRLIETIRSHLKTCGHIGEEESKLVSYLVATSRKMETPLSLIIQGSSGMGKTALMKSALNHMPPEEVTDYSYVTNKSLYYIPEEKLKHKILFIAEEEGVRDASYPLKLLISEGKLRSISTGKDDQGAHHITHENETEGPTSVMSTTTLFEPDDELMNRCLIIFLDESREQLDRILSHQRFLKTPGGQEYLRRARENHKLHQNAQRLLKKVKVRNPYCTELEFSSSRPHALRHQEKYLNLIEVITLLHQYQRPGKKDPVTGEEYIESTFEDIELAGELMSHVFGYSLNDILPKTRLVLKEVVDMVELASREKGVPQQDIRLNRREIREYTGMGDTQLRIHLGRLVDLEYLAVHRGRQGSQYVYELLYQGEGEEGEHFLMGLVDVKTLRKKVIPVEEPVLEIEKSEKFAGANPNFAGVKSNFAGGLRPGCGPDAGGLRGRKTTCDADDIRAEGKTHKMDLKMNKGGLKNFVENVVIGHPTGVECFEILTRYLTQHYTPVQSKVA